MKEHEANRRHEGGSDAPDCHRRLKETRSDPDLSPSPKRASSRNPSTQPETETSSLLQRATDTRETPFKTAGEPPEEIQKQSTCQTG